MPAAGIGVLLGSAVAAGLGGHDVAQAREQWARPRLVGELGGGVSAVKQSLIADARGLASVKRIAGGVSATTESITGLFNPQYYRDFRTWSPPN
jgi:hypothetical protein